MNEWVEQWWNDTDRGKLELLVEKHYTAWLVGEWMSGAMVEWYWQGKTWITCRKTLYSLVGRWMNEYRAMVEWYWQGKTEDLGEKHYTAWVVDGWMSMEQWWNDTDSGKLKHSDINLSQCQFFHHKSSTNCPRFNPAFSGIRNRRMNVWVMALLRRNKKCKLVSKHVIKSYGEV